MTILELPLFYTALFAGLLIALIAGFLSVSVVIRRMSFFSDAIAHATLTGIALGLLLQINVLWSAVGFAILVGLGIAYLSRNNTLSLDTIIGVFYSAAVALGVIIISGLKGINVDLVGLLFGDILGITTTDIILVGTLAIVVLVAFAFMFNGLVQLAISKDLAKVNGVRINLLEYLYMVLLAVTVAIGIKLVGVILIGPMLIMPAAIAKNLSRSLLSMITWSVSAAIAGVVLGFFGSVFLNTPTGPTIILTLAILFGVSLVIKSFKKS